MEGRTPQPLDLSVAPPASSSGAANVYSTPKAFEQQQGTNVVVDAPSSSQPAPSVQNVTGAFSAQGGGGGRSLPWEDGSLPLCVTEDAIELPEGPEHDDAFMRSLARFIYVKYQGVLSKGKRSEKAAKKKRSNHVAISSCPESLEFFSFSFVILSSQVYSG